MPNADSRGIRRIFFDADALIAGSASTTGASHALLVLGELGLIDIVVSKQVVDESERNINSKLPAALASFRALISAACTVVENPEPEGLVDYEGQAHQKDIPILAAAMKAGCEALVTFNTRHYKPKRRAIRIETPGDLLTRLRKELEGLSE